MKWDPIRVAERIAFLRESKGISQRKMSIALEQSESYLNKVENGEIVPPFPMFFQICAFLGVTPEEFFHEGAHLPGTIPALTEELQTLDQETLSHISALIHIIAQK